jgi:hypothetical protein
MLSWMSVDLFDVTSSAAFAPISWIPSSLFFARLVREAEFVVMMQDGVSRDDVQFYTELDIVDCEDADKVNSLQFVKLILVHPVRYTVVLDAAMLNLKRCYVESFQGGVCMQPFIVYCASVVYAEFVVHFLRGLPESIGADKERI